MQTSLRMWTARTNFFPVWFFFQTVLRVPSPNQILKVSHPRFFTVGCAIHALWIRYVAFYVSFKDLYVGFSPYVKCFAGLVISFERNENECEVEKRERKKIGRWLKRLHVHIIDSFMILFCILSTYWKRIVNAFSSLRNCILQGKKTSRTRSQYCCSCCRVQFVIWLKEALAWTCSLGRGIMQIKF